MKGNRLGVWDRHMGTWPLGSWAPYPDFQDSCMHLQAVTHTHTQAFSESDTPCKRCSCQWRCRKAQSGANAFSCLLFSSQFCLGLCPVHISCLLLYPRVFYLFNVLLIIYCSKCYVLADRPRKMMNSRILCLIVKDIFPPVLPKILHPLDELNHFDYPRLCQCRNDDDVNLLHRQMTCPGFFRHW